MPLPTIFLARHGETAWTLTGQHTGLTDLPLTPNGELEAACLATRLAGLHAEVVYTSPLQHASRTCAIAGFADRAIPDPDLVEWDYGDHEGLRSAEIRALRPDWKLFRDGAPNGESVAQASARADRVIARLRSNPVNHLLFSSGHFLRVLATRWLGLPLGLHCLSFQLNTASLSALSYEHNFDRPVVSLWNETHHLHTSHTLK
jgi:probable phosphoglycerate mutase